MVMPTLLSVALLLMAPGILAANFDPYPIGVLVMNSTTNTTYRAEVAYRGILLGALRRLRNSSEDFNFTYSENLDYGPFLESVNGLAGSAEDQTYWELLVKTAEGNTIRPDVGIGCYIPIANEEIILRFSGTRSGAAPPIVSFSLLYLIFYLFFP